MTWSDGGQRQQRTALPREEYVADCEHALILLAAQIRARMHLLGTRWECCSPFDRILAVRRVLREGGLPAATGRELAAVAHNTELHFSSSREAHARGDRVRGLQHEVELQLAERRRDEVLVHTGSVETLLRCAESYLLERPYDREMKTLRELLERRARLEAAAQRLRARALIEGTLAPRGHCGPMATPHGDASGLLRRSHGVQVPGQLSVDDGDKHRAAPAVP